MNNDTLLSVNPLAFPWQTLDPFLFCVFHDDAYPAGNQQLGPVSGTRSADPKNRWSMYHGDVVPGFPHHPHRGFETVTVVRRGFVDHTDSAGASARYGRGDVQWLTAGRGISHAEMFPLLKPDAPNPLELFQIWLNLPRAGKFAEPHFSMFWSEDIPKVLAADDQGKLTEISVIAGRLAGMQAPAPPPESWASRPESDLAIWTIRMEPGAAWNLPAAAPGTNRALYFFRGTNLNLDGNAIDAGNRIELRPDMEITLLNGASESELLLLQGRPIGEPVVQYGPFVMNSEQEIRQAFADYRSTQFGGWPWPDDAPVHPRDAGRFARHTDGHLEQPVEMKAD